MIEIDQRIHSLAEDAAGELYVLTTAKGIPVGKSGKVWKLARWGHQVACALPSANYHVQINELVMAA